MRSDPIRRLAAANPVPHEGPLHLPEPIDLGARRPVVGIALVAALLASAGVAVAAGFGAFEGTPAPPNISTTFTRLNSMADQAVQQGIAGKYPQADVSRAHGVLEIQTPDGPEDLWVAPSDQGGECFFIDWANDPPQQNGSQYGFGGCQPPWATSNPVIPPGVSWIEGHPNLLTVDGSVAVDAASVKIAFADGSTMTLPVVEHFYLGSIDKTAAQLSEAKPVELTAFDAAGNQVAQWTPPQ